MRIGVIGLGNMGAGIAANLIKAGHDVTEYNRFRPKVVALAAAGARPSDSVADAGGGDVVLTMLADDDAVTGVAFGDGGIIALATPDTVHISSSAISVGLSKRLTGAHGAAGRWATRTLGWCWWSAIGSLAARGAGASDHSA